MKKFTAYLLLAAMLASLASCGGDSGASTDTTASAPSGDTTTAAEVDTRLLYSTTDEEIAELELDGYEFNLFVRAPGTWSTPDLVASEQTGEVLNDAIYDRMKLLEDTFGFTMKLGYSADTNGAEIGTYVLAGDDTYDLAFPMVKQAASLASRGVLTDLKTLDYFDLDSGVWSKMFCDEAEWQDKLYFAAGNISINTYQALRAFMFNKSLHEEYGLDNIYDIVREGKWTLDVFNTMSSAVAKDLNGDSKMTAADDQWGMAWQDTQSGIPMFYGADARITTKNSDGIPTLALGDTRTQDIYEKISSIISNAEVYNLGETEEMKKAFKDGRSLFFTEVLFSVEGMRDTEFDFGIIPIPKYDEAQEEYIQFTDDWCISPVCVPINAKNLDRCGFLIQLLAETGMEFIKPVYYDICLTSKYARDEDSIEMLDIVVNNFRVDNAMLYNWGGIYYTLRQSFTSGSGLSSLVAANKSAVEAAIAATAKQMADNAK